MTAKIIVNCARSAIEVYPNKVLSPTRKSRLHNYWDVSMAMSRVPKGCLCFPLYDRDAMLLFTDLIVFSETLGEVKFCVYKNALNRNTSEITITDVENYILDAYELSRKNQWNLSLPAKNAYVDVKKHMVRLYFDGKVINVPRFCVSYQSDVLVRGGRKKTGIILEIQVAKLRNRRCAQQIVDLLRYNSIQKTWVEKKFLSRLPFPFNLIYLRESHNQHWYGELPYDLIFLPENF